MKVAKAFVCAASSVLLLACSAGMGRTVTELRTRAAFDLQCAGSELAVTPLTETTYGVRGCGRQATYVHRCLRNTAGLVNCEWMQDAAVVPSTTITSANSSGQAPTNSSAPKQ
jgi:hypothetical protein